MSILGTTLIHELSNSLEAKLPIKKNSRQEQSHKQDSDAESFISLNHNQPSSASNSSTLKDIAKYTLSTTNSLVSALSFGMIKDEDEQVDTNKQLQSITLDINHLAYLQQEFKNQGVEEATGIKFKLDKDQVGKWSLSNSFNGWFGPKNGVQSGDELLSIFRYLNRLEKLKVGPYDQRVILTSVDGPQWKFTQPVSLKFFNQLTHLTIYRLAPHRFVGWHELAPNLVYLGCRRSILDPDKLLLDTLTVPNKVNDPSQPLWPNLQTLDLSRNDLINFGELAALAISNCSRLSLSNNRLAQVPEGLKELYKLNALDLSFNNISSVSKADYILGNISHLSLRSNELTSLQGLHKLWALQHLDVGHNKLNHVDEIGRLATLPSLINICVEGNPLCDEPHYRVQVFKLFAMSDNLIKVDGTTPQLTEQLLLRSDTELTSHQVDTKAENVEVTLPPSFKEKKVSRRLNKGARRLATIRSISDIDGPSANPSTTTTRRTSMSFESNPDSQGSHQPARAIRFSEAEERQINYDSHNSSLATMLLDPKLRSVRQSTKSGRSSVSPKLDPQSNVVRAFSPPPTFGSPYRQIDGHLESTNWRAEDYRRRIEAMRNEAGTTWLKVFNEIQNPTDPVNTNLPSSLPSSWSQPKTLNQLSDSKFKFTQLEPKVEAEPKTVVEANKFSSSFEDKLISSEPKVEVEFEPIEAEAEIAKEVLPVGTTFHLSIETYYISSSNPQISPQPNSPILGRWIVTETEILQLNVQDTTVTHRYSLDDLMKCLTPTDKRCVRVEFKSSRYDSPILVDLSGKPDQLDMLYNLTKTAVSHNLNAGRLHDRYKQGKCLKCHWTGFLNDPFTDLTRRGGQFNKVAKLDNEPHCPKCNGTFLVEFYGREDINSAQPSTASNLVDSLTNLPLQASQTVLQSLSYANPAPYLGSLLGPSFSNSSPNKLPPPSITSTELNVNDNLNQYSKLEGYTSGQPPFQILNNALRLHLDLSVLQDDDEQVLTWLQGSYLKQSYPLYDNSNTSRGWRLLHSSSSKLPNQLPKDDYKCRQVYLCLSSRRFYLFEPNSETSTNTDPSTYLRLVKRISFDSILRLDVEPNRQALTFHFSNLQLDPTTTSFQFKPTYPITASSKSHPELELDDVPNFSIKLLTFDKLITTQLLDSLLVQLYDHNLTKIVNHDVLWAILDLRSFTFLCPSRKIPVVLDGVRRDPDEIDYNHLVVPDPAVDSKLVVDKVTFDFLKFYGLSATTTAPATTETETKLDKCIRMVTVIVTDHYLYLTAQRHDVWPPPLTDLNTFDRTVLKSEGQAKGPRPVCYDIDPYTLIQVFTKSSLLETKLKSVNFGLKVTQTTLSFKFEVEISFKMGIASKHNEESKLEIGSEPENVPLPPSPSPSLNESNGNQDVESSSQGTFYLLFTNLNEAEEFINSTKNF